MLANHYIPRSFSFWPPLWLTRAHDDLDDRASDGALPVTLAAAAAGLIRSVVAGRAMRFGFDAGEPRIELADPPAGAARAWHGPLTTAQRQQFHASGTVVVPSLLSAAERAELPSAAALAARLRAPLADCHAEPRAGAVEIWLALDRPSTL